MLCFASSSGEPELPGTAFPSRSLGTRGYDSHLVGAILLGDTTLTARVKSAIERREDFSEALRKGPRGEQFAAYLAGGRERA